MEEIVVIIPVHEYNDKVKKMLTSAVSNLKTHICISCPKEIESKIEEDINMPLIFCTTAKNNKFQTLVNAAAKHLHKNKYKWFSILEFDDAYNGFWFNEVQNYYKINPDVSVFLPLTQLMVDSEKNGLMFVGYGNEAPWASAFSNEIGFIDFEVLSNYFDFYLTGGVFNIDDFMAVGGLKESIELTFWYEFLLRLTNKGKKVYVVPKLGYNHLVNRPGSISRNYQDNMSQEEAQWWHDLAKQECYFTQDRNKTYDKNKENEEE